MLHEWSYAGFPQRLGTLEDEYGHRKVMYNAMGYDCGGGGGGGGGGADNK